MTKQRRGARRFAWAGALVLAVGPMCRADVDFLSGNYSVSTRASVLNADGTTFDQWRDPYSPGQYPYSGSLYPTSPPFSAYTGEEQLLQRNVACDPQVVLDGYGQLDGEFTRTTGSRFSSIHTRVFSSAFDVMPHLFYGWSYQPCGGPYYTNQRYLVDSGASTTVDFVASTRQIVSLSGRARATCDQEFSEGIGTFSLRRTDATLQVFYARRDESNNSAYDPAPIAPTPMTQPRISRGDLRK